MAEQFLSLSDAFASLDREDRACFADAALVARAAAAIDRATLKTREARAVEYTCLAVGACGWNRAGGPSAAIRADTATRHLNVLLVLASGQPNRGMVGYLTEPEVLKALRWAEAA